MNLSIIIVNYNTKDLLRRCLRSIYDRYTVNIRRYTIEIIVIDNGSTDGSQGYIKDQILKIKNTNQKSKIIGIFNKRNLGFAKAVNQGIKQSTGEYILLLNSDIITKQDSIKIMLDFVKKHPEVGVVGGRLLNPDGTIQGSCFYLPAVWRAIKEFWLGAKEISFFKKYAPEGKKPVEVEAVMGAVFLIPKKVIGKVGLFDEHYFMYFEDLDYCRRVRKSGFKVYYLPKAEFIHYHGASGRQISQKTHRWLVESSKIYHGEFKYWLITFIVWTGQKWQRFLKKI